MNWMPLCWQLNFLFSKINDSFVFFSKFLFPDDQKQPYKKHLTSFNPNTSTFLLVSDAKHILHGTSHQTQILPANTSLPKDNFNEELGSGVSYRTLIFMVSICKNLYFNLLFLLKGEVLKWPEIPNSCKFSLGLYFQSIFFLAPIISSGLARKVSSAPVQMLNGYSCVSLPHWYN